MTHHRTPEEARAYLDRLAQENPLTLDDLERNMAGWRERMLAGSGRSEEERAAIRREVREMNAGLHTPEMDAVLAADAVECHDRLLATLRMPDEEFERREDEAFARECAAYDAGQRGER